MIDDYKFYHTYRFTENSRIYAFDYTGMVLCEIDELTDAVLESIENKQDYHGLYDRYPAADVDETAKELEELAAQDLFLSREYMQQGLDVKSRTGNISFAPVHNCNLRCRYCFARFGTNYQGKTRVLSRELIRKALDYVYKDLLKDAEAYRVDFVSGGEPLLHFDAVRMINECGRQLFDETGKKLQIWLCTNGTLLNDEYLAYLDSNNIDLGISIDGEREIHDFFRSDDEGNGTYDRVTANIRHLLESPQYSKRLKEIWALSVLNSRTRNLVDIIKHHKSLGIRSMQMKIVRSVKESEYSIREKDLEHFKKLYSDLIDFFITEADAGRTDLLLAVCNDNDFIGKIILRLILRKGSVYRCEAAKSKFSITAEGDIYPCDSFVGTEEFRLGTVFDGVDLKKRQRFYDLDIHGRSRCRECWARIVCGGDCYHNSYLVNGDPAEPDEVMCELQRFVIRRSLMLLNYLCTENTKTGDFLFKFLKKRDSMQIR